jgi:hypothetical protein
MLCKTANRLLGCLCAEGRGRLREKKRDEQRFLKAGTLQMSGIKQSR